MDFSGSSSLTEKWNLLKVKVRSIFSNNEYHVMTEDEIIDEALEESFPASDSPGYRSKTHRDKELHIPSSKH